MTRGTNQSTDQAHPWWADLRHGGLLLSPVVLGEWHPEGPPPLEERRYRRLRDRYAAFAAKTVDGHDGPALSDWLDALLEEFLGHTSDRWRKGSAVPEQVTATSVTGQRLRPQRVLLDDQGTPILLVGTDESPRIGVHRGRRAHARFVELLRTSGCRVGLLTNGRQIRLCHAGLDHDAWCEWEAEAWFAEAETRRQLQGFVALLGPAACVLVNGTSRLLAAVEASRTRQGELSQVLGDQVRRAVEVLVAGLDGAARAHPSFLEPLYRDQAGTRLGEREALAAIYQAATRLVMTIDESDPIGFWRVDQDLPVEQRLSTLTLKAFEHLKQIGLEEFCRQGWELPDYARTFDRPGVKSWTPTEDWPDCERHARNILGEDGCVRFVAGLSGQESEQPLQPSPHVAEPSPTYAPGSPAPNAASSPVSQHPSAIRWRIRHQRRGEGRDGSGQPKAVHGFPISTVLNGNGLSGGTP